MDGKPSSSKRRLVAHSSLPSLPDLYPPGTVLGGLYRVETVLKIGLRICTFRCVSCNDENLAVVVKVFQVGNRARKEMERSASSLLNLQHEGIPPYIGFFKLDSNFCLVQVFVEGASLAEIIDRNKRFSESEGLRIGCQLLNTLEYLSTRQPPVAHGNISDDNIILEGGIINGKSHLTSFACSLDCQRGFSLDAIPGLDEDVPYIGSMDGTCTPSQDVFNLGVVFWSMFSGHSSRAPVNVDYARAFFENETTISNELIELICRMLDPSPLTRITAREACEIITILAPIPIKSESIHSPPPMSSPSPPPRPNRPRPPLQLTLQSRDWENHLKDFKLTGVYIIILALAVIFWSIDVALQFTGVNFEVAVTLLAVSIACTLLVTAGFVYYFFAAFTVLSVRFTDTHFSIVKKLHFVTSPQMESNFTKEEINAEADTPPRRGEFKGALSTLEKVEILDSSWKRGKGGIQLLMHEAEFRFGEDLSDAEQLWLVHRINELRSSSDVIQTV